MSVFNHSLPDVPEHIKDEEYIITYDISDKCYCLYSGYKTVTVGESKDFLSPSFVSYEFKSNSSEWENVFSGIGSYPSPKICRSDTVSIVYSSYNLMTDDGEVYHYSGYSGEQNIICGTISSSTILTTLKNSVFPLVPLVTIAFVGYIAFRKAWHFITGGVRGA